MSKMEYPNKSKRWSRDEESLLLVFFNEGESIAALSARFGRSENAIALRLGRLGCDMAAVKARRTLPTKGASATVAKEPPGTNARAVPSATSDGDKGTGGKRHEVVDMHQRAFMHDYHQRGIYMLTMVTAARRQNLGTLEGSIEDAHICLTELGEKVEHCIRQITTRHPQVRVLGYQIMPDHLHMVVFVDTDMGNKHLGDVVSGFKYGCNKALWQTTGALTSEQTTQTRNPQGNNPKPSPRQKKQKLPSLFESGYHDRILKHKGQLQNMLDYIADNPRRLAVRRAHPDMFHVRQAVQVGDLTMAAVGNIALLDAEAMMAVHVRRSFDDAQRRQYMNGCILAARQGAVLISPFISEKERAVMHVAMKEKLPLILLASYGFQQMYKPPRELFDACAEGRLLILSDQPYNPHARLTRELCVHLNTTAESLAATLPHAASGG